MSMDDQDFLDVWKVWYTKQINEQVNHVRRFMFKPTLFPASLFDCEADCEGLRAAMKGMGTSEEEIINILAKRSAEQRLEIQEKYQQIHGRDLLQDLRSELGGSFEKVILSLMKPLPLLLAEAVEEATKGAGTDEDALIQIFCSRDDEALEGIISTYEAHYEEDLERMICKETNADFEKVLMSVLATTRSDDDDPEQLLDSLADGADEDTIRAALTGHTFPYLKSIFEMYEEKTGETFDTLISSTCSGNAQNAYLAIYSCAKSCPEFFADCLFKAMEGCGTDDTDLIRIIVTRCELDLGTIKEKYEEKYEKNIAEQIKDEVSGDYALSLLTLLGEA